MKSGAGVVLGPGVGPESSTVSMGRGSDRTYHSAAPPVIARPTSESATSSRRPSPVSQARKPPSILLRPLHAARREGGGHGRYHPPPTCPETADMLSRWPRDEGGTDGHREPEDRGVPPGIA